MAASMVVEAAAALWAAVVSEAVPSAVVFAAARQVDIGVAATAAPIVAARADIAAAMVDIVAAMVDIVAATGTGAAMDMAAAGALASD